MSTVDEIKSRLDIVDVVSAYVPSLKKAGRTYKGLCPFHSEKTPSFVVFPDSQTWHCFGACSTGGDIFTFVMKREGYDFSEALKFLAEKAGVPLEERSPEATQADRRRKKLLEMVSVAAQFFHTQLLQSPQAEFCREYVARRGLSHDTVVSFQLGYAPDRWEALKSHLLQRGYSEQDMVAAGLLVTKEENRPGYDRFRDRFIVPIRDLRGQTVGFGARALHDGQQPKYLNSPQSVLFDKSAILFGLDMAKNAIRDAGQAIIVEGYMDALQAHERGFKNVVAEMGTALTERQLRELKRFTKKFVLALDSDSAGSAATLRGINLARQTLADSTPVPTPQGLIRHESRLNVELLVATMPPGKDPDDILRENPSLWQEKIDSALPLMDYYIQTVTAPLDLNSPKGKATAVKEIIPLLREISDPVEQAAYLQQLSRLVKIGERVLREELQRAPATTAPSGRTATTAPKHRFQPEPPAPPQTAAKPVNGGNTEELCLAMVVGKPEMLSAVNRKLFDHGADVLAVEDFSNPANRALFLQIKGWAVSENPTMDDLPEIVSETLQGHLATIMSLWVNQPHTPPDEYVEKELPKMIVRMRRQRLEKRLQELTALQSDAIEQNDRDGVRQWQQRISETRDTLKLLDKAHDALSIMGRRRIEEKYLG